MLHAMPRCAGLCCIVQLACQAVIMLIGVQAQILQACWFNTTDVESVLIMTCTWAAQYRT